MGDEWQVSGVTAREEADPAEVLARLRHEWEATAALEARRQTQTLTFPGNYAVLVFLADQHIGSAGTDYPRLFEEAAAIASTPGMYAFTLGDIIDNFVKVKLAHVRFKTRASIPDEAVAAKAYLDILARKLVASVEGNHERWTEILTGVDMFRDTLAGISPDCLFDCDDCRVTVKVGRHTWRLRLRHDWAGGSIWNLTHGIERAAKFDGDFDVGIGAHTHRSGVARGFDNAGAGGMAILCGSYKRIDPFARNRGFHRANQSTAVSLLLDGIGGGMVGFESLDLAARVIGELQ